MTLMTYDCLFPPCFCRDSWLARLLSHHYKERRHLHECALDTLPVWTKRLGAFAVLLVTTTRKTRMRRFWHHLVRDTLIEWLVRPAFKDEVVVLQERVSQSPVLCLR